MIDDQTQKDLVVLVADQDMEISVRGLLSRYKALGFRKLDKQDYNIYRHLFLFCLTFQINTINLILLRHFSRSSICRTVRCYNFLQPSKGGNYG